MFLYFDVKMYALRLYYPKLNMIWENNNLIIIVDLKSVTSFNTEHLNIQYLKPRSIKMCMVKKRVQIKVTFFSCIALSQKNCFKIWLSGNILN